MLLCCDSDCRGSLDLCATHAFGKVASALGVDRAPGAGLALNLADQGIAGGGRQYCREEIVPYPPSRTALEYAL